uniref:Uncharacterized protein n=2 Tax=Rhodnius prolixus TaxID=13249 RepID=T1HMZ2_RHOPR
MLVNNASASNLLLWPKPQVKDLKFIHKNLKSLGINKLTSIGCGTGLLEWLLTAVTGIQVISIEVDKIYWSTKSRRYNFCELTFPDNEHFNECVTFPKYALLFCYFNNGKAFLEYLANYKGNVLIIIGPNVIGKYTNPMPYDSNIPSNWKLYNQRVMYGNDVIAIYLKVK